MTIAAVAFALFFSEVAPAPSVANPSAVVDVRAGARITANAAWWGFDAADATLALQSAIDSGAKTVIVPNMGMDWVVTPIALRNNLELIFEPGVVVVAKQGAFKGKGDSLFSATSLSDVSITGYGATFRMRKKDYQSSAYEKAEWRMTLDLAGCTNVRISGLRLESSGGDGIYIGATSEQPFCKDVIIRDVVCCDHHRQGVSVISAVNLLIEDCVMQNTGGTAPQAGIDFEPNKPDERLENCIVRNCRMADNTGAGILVYLKPLTHETAPVSILFERCFVQNGKGMGIGVGAISDDGPKGTIEFRDCVVEGSPEGGLYLYDKSPSSARVRFVNCVWKDVGIPGRPGKRTPLLLHRRRETIAKSIGGVDFDDCYVVDDAKRPVLALDRGKGVTLADVQGALYVRNPEGARTQLGSNIENVNLHAIEWP